MVSSRLFRSLTAVLCAAVCCSCGNSDTQGEVTVAAVAAAPASAVDTSRRDGEDWPVFLGPRHDGTSQETGLSFDWPDDGLQLVWETDVGTGYSAPSVRGERLVVHHRVGDEEVVDCLHAGTGEPIWQHAYPSRFTDPYGYNNGPRCSPLLTEEMCYTFGAEGRLVCVQLETGELVWERDLKTDFHAPDGFFGVGATPILESGKLIVAVGGQPNAAMVGLNPATGETIWHSGGKSTWDGAMTDSEFRPTYTWTGDEMVVSYSSPIAATFHGRRHVLCLLRQGLLSVDPDTGKENFHHWFKSRAYESVNAARPVIVDDTIMLSAAYRVGSVRLRVAPDGRSVSEVWRDPESLLTHWSTANYHDGHYFGFSGRHDYEATLRCINAETGKLVWEASGTTKSGTKFRRVNDGTPYDDYLLDIDTGETVPNPFYGRGSAVLVDGHLIALSEYGTLSAIKATSAGWQEVSRFKVPRMHYPSWAAPVLSRGLVYLRCEDALVCYDLKPAVDAQP